MKLRRPKITIQLMMVAVALVAVGLGGEMMRQKRERWLSHVTYHARYETKYEDYLDYSKKFPEHITLDLDLARRLLEYHNALRRKYERAARYPWLSVEPDPSNPNDD